MGAIPTGSGVGVEGGSEVKDESKVGKKLDVEGLSFKILSGTYVSLVRSPDMEEEAFNAGVVWVDCMDDGPGAVVSVSFVDCSLVLLLLVLICFPGWQIFI